MTALVPAAGAGAVIPSGGTPPGPAAMVQAPPHASLLAVPPPPNQGQTGVDWIDADPGTFEIGGDVLRDACQQAEELDYAFALLVQSLRGCALEAVWACADPKYDITESKLVLVQFVKTFMEMKLNDELRCSEGDGRGGGRRARGAPAARGVLQGVGGAAPPDAVGGGDGGGGGAGRGLLRLFEAASAGAPDAAAHQELSAAAPGLQRRVRSLPVPLP